MSQIIFTSLITYSIVFISLAVCEECGICSWYTAYKGAKTANGERFDPNEMTAAHETLPFNSSVRVTIGTRTAVVRINDRGPFIKGRILDVTPKVADILRLRRKGIARCTIQNE